MKIPGLDLDGLFAALDARGDTMQQSLDDLRPLLVKIEESTRPSNQRYQMPPVYGGSGIQLCSDEPLTPN